MQFPRKHLKLIALAGSCAALGAGASAITSAGAAPSTTAGKHARHTGLGPRSLLSRSVHANLVLHTKAGFVNATLDRGAVQSLSGQQLTINEGTPKASYKTITLTIPANARVRDNRQQATLSALKPGQRVVVVQTPKRTVVLARDAKTP